MRFLALVLLPLILADPQTFSFQAETGRLMDIIINSLYTKNQIFLRQVISNASDALDKVRFLSITDPEVLAPESQLSIRIHADQNDKAIVITDTGIGMTKAELIANLGTIAKSGTTNFAEAIKGGNINLIGQFGVGFYSTFLAGKKVQVTSKSLKDDQHVWQSQAAAAYTIRRSEEPRLKRGTQVKIFLKDEAMQYLREDKLQSLITKYSSFIDFPIYLRKVDNQTQTWKHMNDNKAIWLRDPHDVEDSEYQEFFKTLIKSDMKPLDWLHFKVEGQVQFTSILFTPSFAPINFFSDYSKAKNNIKLYVRRVLIMDGDRKIIPKYLSFLYGLVDSGDLDLNVNRESVQQLKSLKVINQKLVKRALDMMIDINRFNQTDEAQLDVDDDQLDAMSEQDREKQLQKAREKQLSEKRAKFDKFYNEFGNVVKLGVIEDAANRDKLTSLIRWKSNKYNNLTSLDNYVQRMKQSQDQIFYLAGEKQNLIENTPIFKKLTSMGYEVFICDQAIDEYALSHIREYKSFKIKDISKSDFKLPDEDENSRKKVKYLQGIFQPLTKFMQKSLFQYVSKVQISTKTNQEPCLLVSQSSGHSAFMEKVHRASTFGKRGDDPRTNQQRILEINPDHLLIQQLLNKVNKNQTGKDVESLCHSLFETAAIQSGFYIRNPNLYAKHFYNVFSDALGVLGQERREIQYDLDQLKDVQIKEEDRESNQEVQRITNADFEQPDQE